MRSLVWKLVLAVLSLALVAAPVLRTTAAWAAAPALEEAQKLYDSAQFADAITHIRAALGSGQLAGNDAVAARALLARCLVKTGNRLEAKQAFKFVLRQQPNWRPDPNSVGPDEQEVFELAQKEVTAEQIQAGNRIPASLSFNFGTGSGDNKNMGEIVQSLNGPDKYSVKPQFGGSVRFPISPRLSIELELQRLRATTANTDPPPDNIKFEVTGYPMSLSLYHSTLTSRLFRLNLFAGGGLLSTAESKVDLGDAFGSGTEITISGQKTGAYFHGGVEAEYVASPRLALAGRVMGRYAKANKVFGDIDLDTGVAWKDRNIDFSGYAATIGLRAYIGY
jgi:hypothetical protein